ncbi:rrf2 family protein, putative transcriptional regulator [Opitutaceae bacterium TAV1]|nr:transcriptional regulator, BadM/Rrf2 family [Opitutaceae bacterium TAV5]EIQ01309.1 rrf2 family protein, putative transcriptional regulator [Opitutaceae bacterium TAV1]
MKLSKKGEYALRALIDLGIAAEVERDLVQVAELADKERIPIKFLEQIMQELKASGFVVSQRGKFGGYRLSRPSSEITVGSVVRLIDGPLAPIGCVSHTAYEKCSCPDETHCGLRMLMLDVRNAIAGILDRYSLADVVEVTTRKMRRDDIPLPFSESRHPPSGGQRHLQPVPQAARSVPPDQRLAPVEGLLSNLLPDYTI